MQLLRHEGSNGAANSITSSWLGRQAYQLEAFSLLIVNTRAMVNCDAAVSIRSRRSVPICVIRAQESWATCCG